MPGSLPPMPRDKFERRTAARAGLVAWLPVLLFGAGCARVPPRGVQSTPVRLASADPPVELAASMASTCARTAAGHVTCWGGCPSRGDCAFLGPTLIADADGADSLHGGIRDVCGVFKAGPVRCWSPLKSALRELTIEVVPKRVVQTVKGPCGLLPNGEIQCWDGEDHDGGPPRRRVAAPPATEVAGNISHACAITVGGDVACWTSPVLPARVLGAAAEPGFGPALVPGITVAVALAVSMGRFSCASQRDGLVKCWGDPSSAKLITIPGLRDPAKLAATSAGACALLRDGHVVCWPFSSDVPGDAVVSPVSGLENVIDIAAGGFHVCALRADGEIDCWGENAHGQLGNGTRAPVEGLSRAWPPPGAARTR